MSASREQAIANLGDYAKETDAKWRVLAALKEGLGVRQALAREGCSFASWHDWNAKRSDWSEAADSARAVNADWHAEEAVNVIDDGLEAIKAADPKSSSAVASMYREKSQTHRWRAAVQAPKRWSEKAQEQAGQQVSVSIYLPSKQELPASALAEIAEAEASIEIANPLARKQLAP